MNRSRFLIDPAAALVGAARRREPLLTRPFTAQRGLLLPSRRLLGPRDAGAITAAGFYLTTWIDILDTTQLAIDLDLETHKGALFSDTVAPNFSSDTAYGVAPYNANEVTGGSWPSGGVAITTTTFTEAATGSMVWDAADVSVATCTFSGAMGWLAYADVLAGDRAIVLVDFVVAVNCGGGTFEIIWTVPGSGGIAYIDMTP